MARILVIDDENNVRSMIRLALEHVGHSVDSAADGAVGLVKFGNGSTWDLVLLDQRMPGMSGLEVLRNMRATDPDARVIMVTAFGTIDLAIEAASAGATDFLRKPFTVDTLRQAVRAALESPSGQAAIEGPLPYSLSSINGYRFETGPSGPRESAGGIECWFTVQGPDLGATMSSVVIQSELVHEIKELARAELPGGERFWEGLAGEALANYLWQHASPPEEALQVDEMTGILRKWVELRLSS